MTSRSRDPDLSSRTAHAWLVALLIVATVLRLHELGAGLWFDEILTLVRYASKPITEIVTTYQTQNNHVLYSLAAAASVSAFGESAWALRLPAAVFGVVSVGAIYAFGIRITTRRAALLAAALATLSYHHIWFSQNARGYIALLAFTLIGSALFLDLLRGCSERRRGLVAMYAISMALAAFAHVTGLIVIAAHAVVWAVAVGHARGTTGPAPDRSPALGVIAAGVLTLILYAPMLPIVVDSILRPDPATQVIRAGTQWSHPLWMVTETFEVLARGAPGGVVGLFAGAVIGIAGIVDYARQSRVVAAVLVLPAILVIVLALATAHNLWPRLLFFSAGFAILVAVRGFFALSAALLPRRAVGVATAAVLLVIAASATRVPAAWGPKQDYEAARQYVEAERAEGDAVVTLAMATIPYESDPLDWTGLITDDVATLEAIERSHARTWAIWAFPTWVEAIQPHVWDRVSGEYWTVAVFPGTVREGTVVVAVRR